MSYRIHIFFLYIVHLYRLSIFKMPSSPKFVNRKFKLPAQSPHCRMACGCLQNKIWTAAGFQQTPQRQNSSKHHQPICDSILRLTSYFLRNNCMLSNTSPAQCGKFAKRIMQTPNLMLKKAPAADILYRRKTTVKLQSSCQGTNNQWMKDEETICG